MRYDKLDVYGRTINSSEVITIADEVNSNNSMKRNLSEDKDGRVNTQRLKK